jgi:predicted PurR-regulated permease PerM
MILTELRTVFLPLCLALLLYFLFNGVVQKMISNRFLSVILPLRARKAVVLFFLLIFIFIVFYLFGVLVFAMATSFIKKFPAYSGKIAELIEQLFEVLRIPLSDVSQYINQIDWTKSINTITSVVSTTFGSFATFLGNLVLIIVFLMFMLAGRQALVGRLNKAVEKSKADKALKILHSIEDRVQHYLLIKTSVSLMTGIISGIILYIGGFDFIIVSAFLIFTLNFIPNIGSVVATAFPIMIGLINYGFSVRVLLVAIALILTQMIIGNVVEPALTGKNLNLSPIIILISLILWGWIWGIIGMILAVPLTSAIKIMFEHLGPLKPVAELISAE